MGLYDIYIKLKCADDWCMATIVSLLIGPIIGSTHEMSVWAKFTKISSRENFYLYNTFHGGQAKGSSKMYAPGQVICEF